MAGFLQDIWQLKLRQINPDSRKGRYIMGKKYGIAMVVMLAFTLGFVVLPGTTAADTAQTLGEFTFTVDKAPKNGEETTMNTTRNYQDKGDKRSHGKKRSKSTYDMKTFDDANQCKASGYSIQVINGKNRGKKRVSSAKIILNDQVLYRQKDFNKGQKFKSISAPLDMDLIKPTGNVLKVLVNGKPGAYVTVGIYGEYSGTGSGGNNVPGALYLDVDGDGYGSTMCAPDEECYDYYTNHGYPWTWVPDGGDCDEVDPNINPSVADSCPACW
jgi:hypothetical protein